jgi:outer membrane receptor protein involved in Fe transport
MAGLGWKTAVSFVALAVGAPALAQEQAEDEIIVTARKVEERLSDVPVAGQVLGEEQLQSLVLDRVDDYIRQIPSGTVVNSGPDYLTDFSIRGQGGGRNGFSESAVGIYRNGIYVAGGGFGGRTFNTLDLFDASRVEVFRGPQGALYGRNAVGGAVNVVSARPDLDAFSARAMVGYDDRERTSYEGVVNVPLIDDRLAVRVGGTGFDQESGFIRDVNRNQDIDTQSFSGVRASALAALSPNWTAGLTAEYSDNHAPGFSILGRRLDVPARAERNDPSPFTRNASRLGRVEINETSVFGELERDGEAGSFSVVAAYKQRDGARFNEDLDHFLGFEDVGGSDLTVRQDEDFTRSGFEVRYASNPQNGGRFLIGADYQTYEDDVVTRNDGATTVAALREVATRTDLSNEELRSASLFGLYEITLADAWTIAAEARIQRDEKDFVFERIDRVPAPANTSIAPLRTERDWTEFVPTLTARYAFSDTSSIYGRIASAYRPGGFNIGTGSVANLAYDPERSTSWEFGWKGRLFDVNLAAAMYYAQTEDLQVVTSVSSTDTTFVLVNVPEADNWGAELEANAVWFVGPGRLFVQGSLAHANGAFGDNANVIVNGVTYNVSNTRLARTRDYTATLLARYSMPLGGGLEGFVSVAGTAENGGYENAIGALKIAGQSRSLQGFDRVDARIGIEGEAWRLSAFVQNAADSFSLIQTIQGNEYYTNPQVAGVQLTLRYGD